MFTYGIISFRDLEEELSKRSLCMDIHGDIRYQDGELCYGGIININDRLEIVEDEPIEDRSEILDFRKD